MTPKIDLTSITGRRRLLVDYEHRLNKNKVKQSYMPTDLKEIKKMLLSPYRKLNTGTESAEPLICE